MLSAQGPSELNSLTVDDNLTQILDAVKTNHAADLKYLQKISNKNAESTSQATSPSSHEKLYPNKLQRLASSLTHLRYEETKFSSMILTAHKESLIDNYKKEPDRAVCDSIGYIRIPLVFNSITCSMAFNLISTSRSTPQSDTAASPNTAPLRDARMARDYDFENPADIFAIAQNLVAGVQAPLKDSHKQKVELDGVEPKEMHNLLHAVQMGGAEPDPNLQSSSVLDMRKGMLSGSIQGCLINRFLARSLPSRYCL